MNLIHKARLIHPWRFPEKYNNICDWIDALGQDEVSMDKASGVSYINGVKYMHDLSFKNESDLLMFCLKFPEFLHSNL